MKKQLLQHPAWQSLSLLAVLPTFYFLISAFLNYEVGISVLWKPTEVIFEMPSNKSFELNINLLILLGPILSSILSLIRILKWQIVNEAEHFHLAFSIKKYAWSWIPLAISVLCLGALFLYSIAENCNC